MNRTTIGFTLLAAVAALTAYGFQQSKTPYVKRLSERHLTLVKGASGTKNTQVASFSAGCFWGVEEEFRKLKGVVATQVGYTGGKTLNPTYEEVCTNLTGHAESVLVEYDPKIVSYSRLLQEFWDLHDPTEGNRQGPDVGTQYRSAIWYYTPEQQKLAIATRDKLQKSGELQGRKITTQIAKATYFYPAEEYHQQYVEKGGVAYCHRRKG